jgi:DNA-binding MarR family transcriptional regulator
MAELPQIVVDLFGMIYRNLLRDENESVELGADSRSAVLSVLRRSGGCSMTDLSRVLRVTKPNITFLVDRLEEQGLLRRKSDASDRRKTTIVLTDKGRQGIEGRRTAVLSRVRDRLALLSQDERVSLEEALSKVMSLVAKLHTEGD